MFEAVEGMLAEHAELETRLALPETHADARLARTLNRRYAELSKIRVRGVEVGFVGGSSDDGSGAVDKIDVGPRGFFSISRRNLWGNIPEVIEMQSEAGAAGAVHE